MTKNHPLLIGGKTIEEWDQLWFPVAGGLQQHQSQLTEEVGLYRYVWNDQTMALGTGTDGKGGIAKRLSDMIRPGWSGRDHQAGKLIFAHRHQLVVEVLLTGSGRQAQWIARKLKEPMMALHRPVWNVPIGASLARDNKAETMRSVRQISLHRRSVLDAGAPAQAFA